MADNIEYYLIENKLLLIVINKNDWNNPDKLEEIYKFINLKEYKNMDFKILIDANPSSDIAIINRTGALVSISCRIKELKNTQQ